MIIEILTILVFFTSGVMTLRAAGLTGWGLLPLGFAAGIGVYIAIGSAQIVFSLPTYPLATMLLAVTLPSLWWALRWRRKLATGMRPLPVLASLGSVAAIVVASRVTHHMTWHSDSFTYLKAGALIAKGFYHDVADDYLVSKRLIGLPLLHAPSDLTGEIYLQSLSPFIALATLGSLVWFFWEGTKHLINRRSSAILAALAVLVLVSTNRFVFHAFYVNAHLLIGMLIMMIAATGWLLMRTGAQHQSAMMALQLVSIPALIVTRPEGLIYAGLALVPTVLARSVPTRHRMAAVATWVMSTAGWQAYAALAKSKRSQLDVVSTSTLLILIIVVFLVILGSLPFVYRALDWRLMTEHPRRIQAGIEASLWLALVAVGFLATSIMQQSLSASFTNIIWPASTWGLSVVMLAIITCGVMLIWRVEDLASLRFALTTTVPLVFVLAAGRGGAYRVADFDSLNRMVIQWFPLMVLFIVVAVATGNHRERFGAKATSVTDSA